MLRFMTTPMPVCVYDVRKKGVLLMTLLLIPFFGIVAFETIAFWASPGSRNDGLIVIILLVCIDLGFTGYVYWRSRRVEFFDDCVRAFPRRGAPIEIPYSQLDIGWQADRNGNTRCILSARGRSEKKWHVYNIAIKRLNTTLFLWINTKTSQSSKLDS